MPSYNYNENNKEFNPQGEVNTPISPEGTQTANELNAKLFNDSRNDDWAEDSNVTVIPAALGSNLGPTQENDRNAHSRLSIHVPEDAHVGLANFDSESRPYRSGDAGYGSSGSNHNDSEELDNEPKVDGTKGLNKYVEKARQVLAKSVGADPNKKFSQWSQKQQIHACGIVGGLITVGTPLAAVGAVILGIGAIVLGITFVVGYLVGAGLATVKAASIKIGQGLNWTAQKTMEGTEYVAGKTKEALVAADKQIRKGASNVLYSIAEHAQAAAGATNYPEELQKINDEQNENFDAVKGLFKDIINGEQYTQEEKRDLIKTILKTIISGIIEPKIAAEKAAGREDGELCKRLNKQANVINGLDLEKLSKLLEGEKTSSIKDRCLIVSTFSEHRDDISEVILTQEEAALNAVIKRCGEVACNAQNQSQLANKAHVETKPRLLARLLKPKAKVAHKSRARFYGSDSELESGSMSESDTSRNENSRSSSNAASTHSADDAVNHNPLLLNRASSVSDNSLNSSDSGVNSPDGSPQRILGEDINQALSELRKTGRFEQLVNGEAKQNPQTRVNQSIINQLSAPVIPRT